MPKIEFLTIQMPNPKYIQCYSAKMLQWHLTKLCSQQKLRKAYVSLSGYLGYLDTVRDVGRTKSCDFTYFGGTVILQLDTVVICLIVHGEGLVEYAVCKPWEIKLRKHYDFPPEGWSFEDNHFYDLGEQFFCTYENALVSTIEVPSVDYYPFNLSRYDEEKLDAAAEKGDLPSGIRFKLANQVTFSLLGSDLEYFYMCVEENNAL